MRHSIIWLAVAAVPASALAQASSWGAFQDGTSNGIGVQAADGSQLIIKCDKPGKRSVYATVFSPKRLVPPTSTFVMRPVKLRFDEGSMREDRWRFTQETASAVDTTTERSMTRFVGELMGAAKVRVILEPVRTNPVEMTFTVGGAKEAVAQVYAACKDDIPVQ